MRKRLTRLPSPSMVVAFIALLAALCGTAVALPGSNTVTSGDIKNSNVKTQDIRNSTVRGRDVRNNTLTGSDVNESSLGTVPRASSAGTAGTAGSAGTAALAGTAFSVPGLTQTGLVGVNDGGTAVMYQAGGFRFSLVCDITNGNVAGSGEDAAIVIENISGGDGSHYDSQDGSDSTDFDQGDPNEYVLAETEEGVEGDGSFGVSGANGFGIDGTGHISVDENGDLPTDCAAGMLVSGT